MSDVVGRSKLRFEAGQGMAGLERLLPAWQTLMQTIPSLRFNHFPEYYRAYVASNATDPKRIWFVAAYREQTLVAIFPLHFQDYIAGAFRPRVLGTIEDDQMQLSDFIFAPTAENQGLLCELTSWLRTQRQLRWDELRLRKVSAESSLAYAARAQLPKAAVALEYHTSAYFVTDGGYDKATAAMSTKFKRNLRRLTRHAEETAPLQCRSYRRPDELGQAFETFLDIESSGWKGEGGTSSAIRCKPEMLAFYTHLTREFGALDACVINLLWHGETPIAGQFCLQIGRTFNILKVGFLESHANIAPGLQLLERMIRKACDDPDIDVLHLLNEPRWATLFKPLITGVWSFFAPNWNARGMLVHLGLLVKRKKEGLGGSSSMVVADTQAETE